MFHNLEITIFNIFIFLYFFCTCKDTFCYETVCLYTLYLYSTYFTEYVWTFPYVIIFLLQKLEDNFFPK